MWGVLTGLIVQLWISDKMVAVDIGFGSGLIAVIYFRHLADLNWKPTPDNINNLPPLIRKYIMHLETNCDPAGLVAENWYLRETANALVLELKKKQKKEVAYEL
jgi:hypothetical protein